MSSSEGEQPENELILIECTQQLGTGLQCTHDSGSLIVSSMDPAGLQHSLLLACTPCCSFEANGDMWGNVVQLVSSCHCVQCGHVHMGSELGHTSFKKWCGSRAVELDRPGFGGQGKVDLESSESVI